MAYHVHKGPDLQATEKIYRKIMSTGRDTGRFSSPGRDNGRFMSPSPHSVGRKSGHPSSRRAVETGSKTGYSSPRGGTVLTEKQMNRHFPDPSEAALKRTHDGVTTHQSLSPASTVRTGQSVSSKKRAVAKSPTPVKSPSSHNRGERHLTGVPFEKKILDVENSERWNRSYQALRLEREWSELHQCRNMKRSSEIVRHRVDKMYMMSGSGIRLKPKYDVNEDELQQLKDLSQARQLLRDKSKKYQMEDISSPHFNSPHFISPKVSRLIPQATPITVRSSCTPSTPDSAYISSPASTKKQIPEVAMLSRTESKSPVYRSDSPESGIQADVQREDELPEDRLTELDDEDLEVEAEFRGLTYDYEKPEFIEAYDERPISRVEIRGQPEMCINEEFRVMDIFKHQLSTNKDCCMLEMACQQADEPAHHDHIDDTPPARESSSHKIVTIWPGKGSYSILPFDPYDNLKKRQSKQEQKSNIRGGRGPTLLKKEKQHPRAPQIQQFPVRKQSSRFIVSQSPILCNCRRSSHDNFSVMSVIGCQMQLATRCT